MTTALQIIKKSMQKNGILTRTEDPTADDANDALDMLNDMLASWSNDSMMCYARTWETFPIISSIGEYLIGQGQTFDSTRPVHILAAYLRQNNIDYPLGIISDEAYSQYIQMKNTLGMPEIINCDNGYPYSKIRLYPVPSTSYQLFILSEKQLTTFTALNQEIILPPGWNRALIYNLAMEMAPDYGVEVGQALFKLANDSKGAIQRAVLKARTMDVLPMIGQDRFNFYAGS